MAPMQGGDTGRRAGRWVRVLLAVPVIAGRSRTVRGALLGAVLGAVLVTPAVADEGPVPGSDPVARAVEVVVMVVDGCPFCARMEGFLADLSDFVGEGMTVERVDIEAPEGRARWEEETAARGLTDARVPVVLIGDRVWVGVDGRIEQQIVDTVLALAPVPARADPSAGPSDDLPAASPEPATEDDGARSEQRDAGSSAGPLVALSGAAAVLLMLGARTARRRRGRGGR